MAKNTTSIAQVKKFATPLLKRYGVKRAALFGSIVSGQMRRDSDIDFLVEFRSRSKSLFDLVSLEMDLSECLKRKVDVVTYRSLHPLLRDRILRERQPIYGKGS